MIKEIVVELVWWGGDNGELKETTDLIKMYT